MTKNEDTSPWMRFPDNPKAIKRHNELVLSSIPTADLVTELSKRDEVTVYPRWVTPDEVFGHRQTLDGRYTMMVVRE